jgi:hypothetical protein
MNINEGSMAQAPGARRLAVASRARDDRIRFERLGPVAFKGVADAIVVHRARGG